MGGEGNGQDDDRKRKGKEIERNEFTYSRQKKESINRRDDGGGPCLIVYQ